MVMECASYGAALREVPVYLRPGQSVVIDGREVVVKSVRGPVVGLVAKLPAGGTVTRPDEEEVAGGGEGDGPSLFWEGG
jgi:hypothetical protein